MCTFRFIYGNGAAFSVKRAWHHQYLHSGCLLMLSFLLSLISFSPCPMVLSFLFNLFTLMEDYIFYDFFFSFLSSIFIWFICHLQMIFRNFFCSCCIAHSGRRVWNLLKISGILYICTHSEQFCSLLTFCFASNSICILYVCACALCDVQYPFLIWFTDSATIKQSDWKIDLPFYPIAIYISILSFFLSFFSTLCGQQNDTNFISVIVDHFSFAAAVACTVN